MSEPLAADFAALFAQFDAPVTAFDCGAKCAPYNDNHTPFCCDLDHAVPLAYRAEWDHLRANSDMWRRWQADAPADTARLEAEVPDGMLLIACGGAASCQRHGRSFTCRAFPFYPYISRAGEFLGMSYYWQYEDRCWVISHLPTVTPQYRAEFIAAFERLFELYPAEKETFRYHSASMRRIFGRKKRAIPLLHRNGGCYKVTPRTGRLRKVAPESLPLFGPYRLAARLPFPDEIEP